MGCHQARQRKFFFILLTPEYYERSRLYWYKMKDYRENPDLIREKLPYLSIDFGELSRSIGWILWREVFEIWKDLAGEFKLQEEDRKRLPLVLQHFIEIGLT